MRFLILAIPLIIYGCSGEPQSEPTTAVEQSAAPVSSNISSKHAWPTVDSTVAVERVDIHDDSAIIKAAGIPVFKTSDSTDSVGEPKKIYEFKKGLHSALELSRSQIIIAWLAAPDSVEGSNTSIKIAQNLARATLGIKGGELVDDLNRGVKVDKSPIDGHPILTATCVEGLCLLKIER